MLRAVLVGLLSVSAGAACGSKDDAPAVPVGAAAGKVVDVTGSVQATRNGSARPLAKDAEVFADDVIATSAGGSVVIELFHNHARWSVESGRTARVDASLAWGLAKQQASAPVDHATAAAGRNAERSAAETGATAAPAAPMTAVPALPAAEPARDPAPVRAEPVEERARAADERADAESPRAAAAEAKELPPPPPKVGAAAGAGAGNGRGGGAASGGGDLGGLGEGDREIVRAKRETTKATAAPDLATVLAKHETAFEACLDASAPRVQLAVVVRAGVARFVVTGGSAEVRACIERVGKKLALTTEGRATLQLEK